MAEKASAEKASAEKGGTSPLYRGGGGRAYHKLNKPKY